MSNVKVINSKTIKAIRKKINPKGQTIFEEVDTPIFELENGERFQLWHDLRGRTRIRDVLKSTEVRRLPDETE